MLDILVLLLKMSHVDFAFSPSVMDGKFYCVFQYQHTSFFSLPSSPSYIKEYRGMRKNKTWSYYFQPAIGILALGICNITTEAFKP